MNLAKGWERESADLFIHESGARIQKSSYRGKMAWWFFPASLDVPAVEHAPTDEGRDEAFATSMKQLPKTKTRAKAKVKKETVEASDGNEKGGQAGEGAESGGDAEEEEEDEKEDSDEKD
jgi:hypothetical protein